MSSHDFSIVDPFDPRSVREMKGLLRRVRSFEGSVKDSPVTLDPWQIYIQHSALSASPWRCSDSYGHWTGYEFFSNHPPGPVRRDVRIHRLRHVQAREVLNGFLPHRSHPRGVPGTRLAFPRFVHGGGLRRTGALPRLRRTPDLPDARHESPNKNRPGSATPARWSSSPPSPSPSPM